MENNRRERLKRKAHFDQSSRVQIWRNKREIEERIQDVQTFCHRLGLEIANVTIMRLTDISNKPVINFINEKNDQKELKSKRAMKALQAKDQSNLSDLGYNRFLQNFKYEIDFPTLEDLKEKRKALRNFFQIEHNALGVYIKPLNKLRFVCENYIKYYGPVYENTFNIKLHGDSINVSKTGIKLLIFAFSLIEIGERPMSVEGNYILGIFTYFYFNFMSLIEVTLMNP